MPHEMPSEIFARKMAGLQPFWKIYLHVRANGLCWQILRRLIDIYHFQPEGMLTGDICREMEGVRRDKVVTAIQALRKDRLLDRSPYPGGDKRLVLNFIRPSVYQMLSNLDLKWFEF